MPEQAFHPEGKAGTIIKSAHLASLSVFSGGDPRVALKSEIRRPKPRGRGRFGLRSSFGLRPSAFGFDPRGYKQDDPDGVFRTQSFNVPIGIAACLMRGCFPLSSKGGEGICVAAGKHFDPCKGPSKGTHSGQHAGFIRRSDWYSPVDGLKIWPLIGLLPCFQVSQCEPISTNMGFSCNGFATGWGALGQGGIKLLRFMRQG